MDNEEKHRAIPGPSRWSGRLVQLLLALTVIVAAFMVLQDVRRMLSDDDASAAVSGLLPLDQAIERLDEQSTALLVLMARRGLHDAVPMPERGRVLERFLWARGLWDSVPETERPDGQLIDHQVDVQLERFERLLRDWSSSADTEPSGNALIDQNLQLQGALNQFSAVLHAAMAREQMGDGHDDGATGHALISITVLIALFLSVTLIHLLERRRKDRTIGVLDQYARLSSQASGQRLFEGVASFLGTELDVDYVLIGRLDPAAAMEIETMAVWGHGQLQGNLRYALQGTPCNDLLSRDVCIIESGVCDLYPDDALLRDMGVTAYMGTTLHDSEQQPLGILVLMNTTPLAPAALDSTLLKIASARVELELERMHAEREREQMLAELESRVDLRTRDLRRINQQLQSEIEMRGELEAQQSLARLQAEELASSKGAFITRASHEIRTHINGLLGMLSLLEDREFSAEDRSHIATALSSGNTLLALINDLLDISKIEAGQLRLERVDFDLQALFRDLRDLYAARAEEKGLTLKVEVDGETETHLHGDVGRLRQVLANLVDNACKFTDKGSITLRASPVALPDHPLGVRIEVVDTGIGIGDIPPETLLRAYSQGDETIARRFGGTGLGLAIASQLVELMGGTLEMESCRDGGSRFWVALPFELPRTPLRVVPTSARGKPLDQQRILVVDDSRISRTYLTDLLQSWQIDCVEAEDGMQALQAVADEARAGRPFDSVIMDRVMPEMDGIELARRMRELPGGERMTMIMATRFGSGISGEEVLRAGITKCLNKPVSQSELFDALSSSVGARSGAALPAGNEVSPGWRLLVVEDNEVNQRVALGLLGKLGLSADVAANGLQAIEALERRAYDLVLMDCQMPELDGYAATRRIRMLEPGIRETPIVAMTAHALGGEREKCLAAGMDDYLAKPVRLDQLKTMIEYWCRAGRAARQMPPTDAVDDAGDDAVNDESSAAPAHEPDTLGEPLNAAVLDELRLIMGDEMAVLLDTYLADTQIRIEAMGRHLQLDELQAVAEIAHTLKGSSLNLGAEVLGRNCDRLYKGIGAGETGEPITSMLTRIEQNFARLRPILLEYRAAAEGVS